MSESDWIFGSLKNRIKNNFDNVISAYENEAEVQRSVARRLAAALEPWKLTLPVGPILELGAGTGFFTREMVNLFPERRIEVTDLSANMIKACRQFTSGHKYLTFHTLDAEEWNPPKKTYALISGNFVAQWFRNPALTLDRHVEALKPGGLLLTSFPGPNSFPEWKEQCVELGLPFTRNPLPDIEEVVVKLSTRGVQVDYYEDFHTVEFEQSLDFFRHLKKIGASTSISEKSRLLTPKEFRLLTDHWDRQTDSSIRVTYHLVFLAVKKQR
ncbi:MAG: methyltransferase domain-containing protein [Balneolaceae bacterium]